MTMQSPRSAPRATAAIALATAAALLAPAAPVHAQGVAKRGLPIVRDAEAEQLLRDYARPILQVAGLAKQNIQVVIINDRVFNAFVADGHRIFVNAGALMESKTPNQMIGVLAHETGHLAGGHLSRLREQVSKAQTQAIVAMLLGVGAMVAGATTRTAGGADIGAAALTMPQAAIQRSLLAYVRTQEEQADRAGVKFLTATHQSAKGMYDTFKRFADQTLFYKQDIDPYTQTHPMPAERVEALEALAKSSPYWDKKDSPELQLRHDLVRAKLSGFVDTPDTVARRYPMSDTSLPARYARAISAYRFGNLRGALNQIDGLIHSQPNNPYFHELKGQALLETGHPGEAIAPLRRAVHLAPNPVLIQAMLGQAMIAANDPKLVHEAVALLRRVVTKEPELPEAYAQLAMAYGRSGSYAEADLASAQAAATRGDIKTARQLAARAKTRFPVGSPGWIRADDIFNLKQPSNSGPQR
jgi:predicted Zn-dependent protease